ncbi:MAG: PHP domain-containing protein, partial [Chthoniobacterales bacterium]
MPNGESLEQYLTDSGFADVPDADVGVAKGEAAANRVAAAVRFVHLHVHTSFSLREGALSIAKLAKLAAADSMPALAITDTNNLFGALEFSEKLAKEGIQPIIGAELTIDFGDGAQITLHGAEVGSGWASLVLLAKDEIGYRNLMHLVSRAWLEPESGDLPHVPIARLESRGDGLIALSGGPNGPLDRCFAAGRPEVAERRIDALQRLFARRLYIELQRHGLSREREIEPQLTDLSYRRGLPLVASNEPYFATAADYEAHDALLC